MQYSHMIQPEKQSIRCYISAKVVPNGVYVAVDEHSSCYAAFTVSDIYDVVMLEALATVYGKIANHFDTARHSSVLPEYGFEFGNSGEWMKRVDFFRSDFDVSGPLMIWMTRNGRPFPLLRCVLWKNSLYDVALARTYARLLFQMADKAKELIGQKQEEFESVLEVV